MCPGRGSYGASELGSLPAAHPVVDELDGYRRSLGRTPLSELDRAPRFSARLHVAGENASLLTFACSAVDLAALDPAKAEPVGVIGNSLGWYTALYAAGALELAAAARLVETFGHWQADGVVGGQLIYPVMDEEWRPVAELSSAAERALRLEGVFASIRLGGSIVFGATEDGIRRLREVLPPIARGGRDYPLQLPLHSAFHTPLMAATAERAERELHDLPFRSPRVSLVAGDGRVHRPWASPDSLRAYTLRDQVVRTFDFTTCLLTAVGELGPEAIVVTGPGDTLGAPIAQALIGCRWRGLRDRRDFLEAQAGPKPLVISMARPAQRALVELQSRATWEREEQQD